MKKIYKKPDIMILSMIANEGLCSSGCTIDVIGDNADWIYKPMYDNGYFGPNNQCEKQADGVDGYCKFYYQDNAITLINS